MEESMTLAILAVWALAQTAPQPPAQQAPRYPVDPANCRAIGATEIAPDVVEQARAAGQKIVVIDVRPAAAFEKETIPGAINIPLAEVEARLSEFTKDTTLVFT
jgi:3-mercaptopyruvate sulfurtransferase SseA